MKKYFTIVFLLNLISAIFVIAQPTQNFFVKNAGQMAKNILYCGYADGYKVIIAKDGIYLNHQQITPLQKQPEFYKNRNNEKKQIHLQSDNIKMSFLNSNIQDGIEENKIITGKELNYTIDFINFKADKFWISDVPVCQMLTIEDIYDGTDLVFYFEENNIRYDFHLNQYAKPENIEMKFEGCKEVAVKNNEIILTTELGTITNGSIKSFNTLNNQLLPTKIAAESFNTVKFEVENKFPNTSVIIDPLIYSTFYAQTANYYTEYSTTLKITTQYWVTHSGRFDGFVYTDTLFKDEIIAQSFYPISVINNNLKSIDKIYIINNAQLISHLNENQFLLLISNNMKSIDFIKFKCFTSNNKECNSYLAIADFSEKKIINALGIRTNIYNYYDKNTNLLYSIFVGLANDYLTANAYDSVSSTLGNRGTGHIQVVSGDLDTVLYASYLGKLTGKPYAVCTDKEGSFYILGEGTKLSYRNNDTVVMENWVNPDKYSQYFRSVLIKFDKNFNFVKSIGYYGLTSKKMKYNKITNEIILGGTSYTVLGNLSQPCILAFDTDLNFKRERNIKSFDAGIGLPRTWIDADAGDITIDEKGEISFTGTVLSDTKTGYFDYPLVNDIAYKTYDGHEVNVDYQTDHDAFVTKISSDFSKILYSTVFGGGRQDTPYFIDAEDSTITVFGETQSFDLPMTPDAMNPFFKPTTICLFFARFQYSPTTGIADSKPERIPLLYPNPAGSYITLSESDTKYYSDYAIYDISGRCLRKAVLESYRIDIYQLERGSYYLRLNSPAGVATAGFLKME